MIAAFRIGQKLVLASALVASIVSAGSVAYGAASKQVCFQDVRSWEAVRTQLPPLMQRNELYAVHQSRSMIGGFKIVQAGRNILMELHGKHSLIGHLDEVDTLKQVCLVDGKKIKVSFSKGGSNVLEIVPSGLKTQGVTFTLTSAVGYDQVVAAIPPRRR
ncbi:MAG TPA: hypothetical protein VM432_03570 [Bdellovibrionales bacterium]|nr:hypothetical protein [Bdellovibrionales bacterium]